MSEADAEPTLDATSFFALAAFTVAGSLEAAHAMPAHGSLAIPMLMAVLFASGAYLALCSTFFKDFTLYRAKADQLVHWAGVEDAHLVHRVVGFASMGASVWLLSGL